MLARTWSLINWLVQAYDAIQNITQTKKGSSETSDTGKHPHTLISVNNLALLLKGQTFALISRNYTSDQLLLSKHKCFGHRNMEDIARLYGIPYKKIFLQGLCGKQINTASPHGKIRTHSRCPTSRPYYRRRRLFLPRQGKRRQQLPITPYRQSIISNRRSAYQNPLKFFWSLHVFRKILRIQLWKSQHHLGLAFRFCSILSRLKKTLTSTGHHLNSWSTKNLRVSFILRTCRSQRWYYDDVAWPRLYCLPLALLCSINNTTSSLALWN